MTTSKHKTKYIFDNIDSGVILLDKKGEVEFINPFAKKLLGLSEADLDNEFFLSAIRAGNDTFVDLVLNALDTEEIIKNRTVPFNRKDSKEIFLDISVSRKHFEDNNASSIIILINDASDVEYISRQKQNSEYMFIAYLCYITLYIICNSAMELILYNPVHRVGNFVALFLAVIILTALSRKVSSEFLLAPLKVNKNRLVEAFVKGMTLCLLIGGSLIGIKLILWNVAPDMVRYSKPFFYFARLRPDRITVNTMLYPFTAFWQEYLMNVMAYDGMRTILVGKHKKYKAAALAALFFGAMHYTYGFPMILLTSLFVLFMNYIYRRTHNLWVCWLMHFILGQLLFTLQLQKIGL